MRVEFDLSSRFVAFLAVIAFSIAVVGLANAYGGSSPTTMGHSVGEVDWSGTIPSLTTTTLHATNMCFGSDCRNRWNSCQNVHPYDGAEIASTVDRPVDIPVDSCMGDNVCMLIFRVYDSTKITAVRIGLFNQQYTGGATEVWDMGNAALTGNNGDTTSSDVLTSASSVYLRDDQGTAIEKSTLQWTILDNSASAAGELIVCKMT